MNEAKTRAAFLRLDTSKQQGRVGDGVVIRKWTTIQYDDGHTRKPMTHEFLRHAYIHTSKGK